MAADQQVQARSKVVQGLQVCLQTSPCTPDLLLIGTFSLLSVGFQEVCDA